MNKPAVTGNRYRACSVLSQTNTSSLFFKQPPKSENTSRYRGDGRCRVCSPCAVSVPLLLLRFPSCCVLSFVVWRVSLCRSALLFVFASVGVKGCAADGGGTKENSKSDSLWPSGTLASAAATYQRLAVYLLSPSPCVCRSSVASGLRWVGVCERS